MFKLMPRVAEISKRNSEDSVKLCLEDLMKAGRVNHTNKTIDTYLMESCLNRAQNKSNEWR